MSSSPNDIQIMLSEPASSSTIIDLKSIQEFPIPAIHFSHLEAELRQLDQDSFCSLISTLESEITSMNAEARFKLGFCYFLGLLKPLAKSNIAEVLMRDACTLWKNKVEISDTESQAAFNLANCFENGWGVSKDVEQAKTWFTVAAVRGHFEAQIKLLKFEDEVLQHKAAKEEIYSLRKKASLTLDGGAEHTTITLTHYFSSRDVNDAISHEKIYDITPELQSIPLEQIRLWEQQFQESGNLDPFTLCKLGFCYLYGIQVTRDGTKTLVFLNAAAKQGFIEAYYLLGVMSSLITNANSRQSQEAITVAMFKKVVSLSNIVGIPYPAALYELAKLYSVGNTVVACDDTLYFTHLLEAAKAGHSWSQHYVAGCFKLGRGVGVNADLELYWCKQAAESGVSEAQFDLGVHYEQINQPEKSVEWLTKSAEQYYPSALCALGIWHFKGHNVNQDYDKALEYLNKSVEKKSQEAKVFRDLHYKDGFAINTETFRITKEICKPHNNTRVQIMAIEEELRKLQKDEFIKLEAIIIDRQKADPVILCKIGFCYLYGIQVSQDVNKAIELFNTASDLGYEEAIFLQGFLCDRVGDKKQAAKFYILAAQAGSLEAKYALAIYYFNGFGDLSKDLKMAFNLFLAAAKGGHLFAQKNLVILYDEGLENVVAIDKAQALAWISRSALQDETFIQANLADFFYQGKGFIPQDKKLAVEWWERAAKQGDTQSLFNAGICYEKGDGVPRDPIKARKLIEKAASQNHAGAQNSMGLRLLLEDAKSATPWFTLAIGQGYAVAWYNLGICQFLGHGLTKDTDKALGCFKQAAKKGYDRAQKIITNCYDNTGKLINEKIDILFDSAVPTFGVALNPAPKNILTKLFAIEKEIEVNGVAAYQFTIESELKKLSIDEFRKLEVATTNVNQANPEDLCKVGFCYLKAFHVKQDVVKAFNLFKAAEKHGFVEASYLIGIIYDNFVTDKKTGEEEAFVRYKIAADLGCVDAKFLAAMAYYDGRGVIQNKKIGFEWLEELAKGGHTLAQTQVAEIYNIGDEIINRDPERAIYFLKLAAEKGHLKSQVILGNRYYFEENTPENKKSALEWWERAAEQGDPESQSNIAVLYHEGIGTNNDPTKAYYWFEKAAIQRIAHAQNMVAIYLYNKNPASAVNWFRLAANQGNAQAICNLGACYFNGHGVEKDPITALLYFRQAAKLGYAKAQANIDIHYKDGVPIGNAATALQIQIVADNLKQKIKYVRPKNGNSFKKFLNPLAMEAQKKASEQQIKEIQAKKEAQFNALLQEIKTAKESYQLQLDAWQIKKYMLPKHLKHLKILNLNAMAVKELQLSKNISEITTTKQIPTELLVKVCEQSEQHLRYLKLTVEQAKVNIRLSFEKTKTDHEHLKQVKEKADIEHQKLNKKIEDIISTTRDCLTESQANIASQKYQPTNKDGKLQTEIIIAHQKKNELALKELDELTQLYHQLSNNFVRAEQSLSDNFEICYESIYPKLVAALERNDLESAKELAKIPEKRLSFQKQMQVGLLNLKDKLDQKLAIIQARCEAERKVINAKLVNLTEKNKKQAPKVITVVKTNATFENLSVAAGLIADNVEEQAKYNADREFLHTKKIEATAKRLAKLKEEIAKQKELQAKKAVHLAKITQKTEILKRNIDLERQYYAPAPAKLLNRTELSRKIDVFTELNNLRTLVNGLEERKNNAEHAIILPAILGGIVRLLQMNKRIKSGPLDSNLARKMRNNLYHVLEESLFAKILVADRCKEVVIFAQQLIILNEKLSPKPLTLESIATYVNAKFLPCLLQDYPKPSLSSCNEEVKKIIQALEANEKIAASNLEHYKTEARFYLIAKLNAMRAKLREWLIALDDNNPNPMSTLNKKQKVFNSTSIQEARKFLHSKKYKWLTSAATAYRHGAPQFGRVNLEYFKLFSHKTSATHSGTSVQVAVKKKSTLPDIKMFGDYKDFEQQDKEKAELIAPKTSKDIQLSLLEAKQTEELRFIRSAAERGDRREFEIGMQRVLAIGPISEETSVELARILSASEDTRLKQKENSERTKIQSAAVVFSNTAAMVVNPTIEKSLLPIAVPTAAAAPAAAATNTPLVATKPSPSLNMNDFANSLLELTPITVNVNFKEILSNSFSHQTSRRVSTASVLDRKQNAVVKQAEALTSVVNTNNDDKKKHKRK